MHVQAHPAQARVLPCHCAGGFNVDEASHGGGGGAARPAAATAANAPPQRPPDAVLSERIPENAAALYRLSGDANPVGLSLETRITAYWFRTVHSFRMRSDLGQCCARESRHAACLNQHQELAAAAPTAPNSSVPHQQVFPAPEDCS